MDVGAIAAGVKAGGRRALSRAVTLVESGRADHREKALALLDAVSGSGREAIRIGLSGPPGVGKSTFIEAFGLHLIGKGLSVAVLAVDPSSARTGGSILGDKTRMEALARHPRAYIRPSPSRLELGGVGRRTREAVTLCEAAGFDVVLIETVGVGQSETTVARLTDVFVLLQAPGGGDELQGVKRGIMEHADLILVNKCDGDLAGTAERTAADYAGALRFLRRRPGDPEGYPLARAVSAAEQTGLDATWEAIAELARWRRETGHWAARRADQALGWLGDEVRRGILAWIDADEGLRAGGARIEAEVAAGRLSPSAGAQRILEELRTLRAPSEGREPG